MRIHGFWMAVALAAAGCASPDNLATKNPLLPDKAIKLTAGASLSLEAAAGAALLFVVIDPLAPNWQVESRALGGGRYDIALTMKRFIAGGEGEAPQVFRREAGRLAQLQGAPGYRIAEFSEGIDSQVLVARRVARGVVELQPVPAAAP